MRGVFSQLVRFHGRLDVWTTLLVLFRTWYWEVVQQTAVLLFPHPLLKPLFDITRNFCCFVMEFLFLGCMVSVQHIFVQYLILWQACGEEKGIRGLVGKLAAMRLGLRARRRWDDNIKRGLQEIGWEVVDCIDVPWDRDNSPAVVKE
jgi:hypothetical protein